MKGPACLVLAAAFLADPAFAQADAERESPPAIDIRIDTAPEDERYEDCSPQQEDAAAISGEIVVCRRRTGSEHRLYGRDEAQDRYARETMNQGTIAAPDVAGAGIFRGPATVGGLCLIPPCPPPPAYMIDFAALPEPPKNSDADRIARGLPPLGTSAEAPLDPERPDGEAAVSPPVSALPAAAPSD